MNEKYTPQKKRLFVYLFFIAVLFSTLLLTPRVLHLYTPQDGKERLFVTSNVVSEEDSTDQEIRFYAIAFEASAKGTYHLRIIADNCLESIMYRGKSLLTSSFPRCNYPEGETFAFDAPSAGKHWLIIGVRNSGGPMGVEVQPTNLTIFLAETLLVFFVLLLIREFTGIGREWSAWVQGLLLLALTLAAMQSASTIYYSHTNDTNGHLDYIFQLVQNYSLPLPSNWQQQQPPLYYFIGALFYGVGQFLHVSEPFYVVRLLSYFCYAVFLVFNLRLLNLYLSGRWFVLASALTLLWPEGFNFAGKISNDVPQMMLTSISLYYISRWYITWRKNDLRVAQYSAVIGLLVKGTAIIPIAAVALCMAWVKWQKPKSKHVFFDRPLIFCAILSCMNFVRIAYHRWNDSAESNFFIPIQVSKMEPHLFTENHLYNYVYFDLLGFLQKPFDWSSIYFWSTFLKTLLFGEWIWQSELAAGILCFALVLICIFILSYLFLKPHLTQSVPIPILAFLLCMLGAMIAGRIMVPWAPQCNARYVYGIITIFAFLLVRAMEWHKQSGRTLLFYTGGAIIITFCGSSILLITKEIMTALDLL